MPLEVASAPADPVLSAAALRTQSVTLSNLRVATGQPYEVVQGGLEVGAPKYIDRGFVFTRVPAELQGLTYIRTADADKSVALGSTNFLRFDVSHPVAVYVIHHDENPVPEWLSRGFAPTELKVHNQRREDRTEVLSVFRREYAAGTVVLGSNADAEVWGGTYTVAVAALPYAEEVTVSELRVVTGRSYEVVEDGFATGAVRYIDSEITFARVPAELRGLTYIRTADADKNAALGSTNFLRFEVDQPATVYVLHDDNIVRPAWLYNEFFNTGIEVKAAAGSTTIPLTVFRKDFPAGTVRLGANAEASTWAGTYSVLVAPAGANPMPPLPPMTDFGPVVHGTIRPRGFGKGEYRLVQPAPGGTMYYVATNGKDSYSGTSSAPFRTIGRAAEVAAAGDVVTIRAGTYRESVAVRNSGTANRRIVFQAESRGEVVLTGGQHSFGPASWTGGRLSHGEFYVTLRGLIFRDYAGREEGDVAVQATRGWHIEDCLLDRAGRTGIDIRDDFVAVTRSTLQYNVVHALVAAGRGGGATDPSSPEYQPLDGLRFTDLVLRGNFTLTNPLERTSTSAVAKMLATRGTVVDNIESYENYGPGFWFDHSNTHFVVRNSYFHHNRWRGEPGFSPGRGLHLELGWGPGLVENNVMANNSHEGLALNNSGGVTVRNNLFVDQPQCIRMYNGERGLPLFPLRDLRIEGNYCKGWTDKGGITPWSGSFTSPSRMNIRLDGNVYDPGPSNWLTWWPGWGQMLSIAGMRSNLGWEQNGRIGPIRWPY